MHIGRIEHVNLTVSNIHRSEELFKTLLGWKRRWSGPAQNGGETIHVGEEGSGTYLALYSDGAEHRGQKKARPLNHVGIVVEDLDRADKIVREHGLIPYGREKYEPGERFYFFDWDGVEFEIVSY